MSYDYTDILEYIKRTWKQVTDIWNANNPHTENGHENVRMKKRRIINQNEMTQIATLNTRTIREPHKRAELFHLFENSEIDILGLQEHRVFHTEEEQSIRAEKSETNKSVLYTASAVKNSRNAVWVL